MNEQLTTMDSEAERKPKQALLNSLQFDTVNFVNNELSESGTGG